LAISPDALVFRDEVICGGVEIKCPSSKKHIEYIRTGKIPAEYVPQVRHYFVVIDDLEFVDFVSYDARVRQHPFHRVRVTRKEWEGDIATARAAYDKFILKLEKYEREIVGSVDV
jgi:hypothetical protein